MKCLIAILFCALTASAQLSLQLGSGPVQFAVTTATNNVWQLSGPTNSGGGGGDITNGLVFRFKCNDSSGTTLHDSVGAYDCIVHSGSISWGTGLAGLGDVINTDPTTSLDSGAAVPFADSDSITICGWFSFAQTNDVNVVSRGVDGYGAGWSVGLSVSGMKPSFAVISTSGGPAYFVATGSTTLATNTWYHLAGVWNPGTGLTVYLNGSSNGTTATGTTGLRSSTFGLNIFRLNTGSPFLGAAQDIRGYNRVLSAELATIYSNGPQP